MLVCISRAFICWVGHSPQREHEAEHGHPNSLSDLGALLLPLRCSKFIDFVWNRLLDRKNGKSNSERGSKTAERLTNESKNLKIRCHHLAVRTLTFLLSRDSGTVGLSSLEPCAHVGGYFAADPALDLLQLGPEVCNLLLLFHPPLLQRLDCDHQDSIEVTGCDCGGCPNSSDGIVAKCGEEVLTGDHGSLRAVRDPGFTSTMPPVAGAGR